MTASTTPILFHFIEQHGLDGSREYEANPGWTISSQDDRPIGGLEELVDFVASVCETQHGAIGRLNLVCHGHSDGIWVGKDWISNVGAMRWQPVFARLAALFAPGAGVTVHSSEGGTDRLLLGLLQRVWPDTRGEGYLDPYGRHIFVRQDEQGQRVCRRRLCGVLNVIDES